MTYHVSVSVSGALRNGSFAGFTSDDGRPLSKLEAKAMLRKMDFEGVKLISSVGCDNFDPSEGCLGHPPRAPEGP